MPKVLTKLRVDEISCVDRGAGDGCNVVLSKRDDERRGFYHRLFAGKQEVRKARYRGASSGRLHMIENLTPAEAKHWLLHSAPGRMLLRDTGGADIDELAAHVCEASRRPAETPKGPRMDDVPLPDGSNNRNKRNNREEALNVSDHLVEVCKSVVSGEVLPPTEHELVQEIKKLANSKRLPNETSAAAFNRLFTAQDDDGLALRKAVQIAKGHPHPHVGARS
jgi:hypothetical protein